MEDHLHRYARRGASVLISARWFQFVDDLWKRATHVLRRGFADTLKQAGVDTAVINDISGGVGTSETELRYTNAAGLLLIIRHLERYPIITGHLEARPIRLLPWVENKELPLWAGKKPGDRSSSR